MNRRRAAEEREKGASRAKAPVDESGDDSKEDRVDQQSHHRHTEETDIAKSLMDYSGIFVQAFHQLHELDPATLRSNHQSWNVTMEGESGIDVGGVFRDSLTEFCNELCSSYFPMFIKSPNARDQQGKHRDKFVPNPRHIDPLSLQMYEFVGKLMGNDWPLVLPPPLLSKKGNAFLLKMASFLGAALRTKELLPLDLPSMVWNPLVGIENAYPDLEAVDVLACR